MGNGQLHIAPGLLAVIRQHCADRQPDEACGFLLGHDTTVLFGMAMENTSPEPTSRYRISPEQAATAVHRAISLGVEIIGGWHSHPNGPDDLSHADRAASPAPEFVHLLIGRDLSVQAFRVFAPTRVRSVPIALRHGGHQHSPGRANLDARQGHPVRERIGSEP